MNTMTAKMTPEAIATALKTLSREFGFPTSKVGTVLVRIQLKVARW